MECYYKNCEVVECQALEGSGTQVDNIQRWWDAGRQYSEVVGRR